MTELPEANSPAPLVGGNGAQETDRAGATIEGDNTQKRARRQHLVRHLHAAGPRPVLEALLELERGAALDDVLERFARIPPDVYRALGADRFPPMPLTVVRAA